VYNFDAEDDSEVGKWKYEAYETNFGPLGKWIVEDGRSRGFQRAEELRELNPNDYTPEKDEPKEADSNADRAGAQEDNASS
jgi:hypothetical protein